MSVNLWTTPRSNFNSMFGKTNNPGEGVQPESDIGGNTKGEQTCQVTPPLEMEECQTFVTTVD